MRKPDTITGELATYEAALRSATTSLPPNVVESMVEDLRAHAAELAADEPDVPLSERLGSPTTFAAEYRRAAAPSSDDEQPPPQDTVARPTGWRRLLFPFGILCYTAGIVCFTAALVTSGNEGYQLPSAALALVGVLLAVSWRKDWTTPAAFDSRTWPEAAQVAYVAIWALRGWGLVILFDAFVVGGDYLYPQLTGFPLPQYFGLGLGLGLLAGGAAGGLIAILTAALLSIYLGRGEHHLGKWQTLIYPVTLVLATAPLLAWISVMRNGL